MIQKPTKGVKPHFDGVPGVLITGEAPSDVVFGSKRFKTSPYDPLLLQLKAAKPPAYLKFEDLRARASLAARAKKLGLKILFGEQGNTLWVSMATAEVHASGATEKQPDRPSLDDLAVRAVTLGKQTAGEILTWMRSNGGDGLGLTQVDRLLLNLARANKIKLKPKRAGSLDDSERWILC